VTRSDDWTPDQAQWPEWMKLAARDVGVRELPGVAVHPRIAEYYTHTRLGGMPNDDETAWCSAAMCTWMEESGYKSTRSAKARSWLGWGDPIKLPKLGCVVVFSRGDPAKEQGHVGLFCELDTLAGHIMLLGGNQRGGGGSVSFSRYPRARLLGFRWPNEADRLDK
jgi:uncharacterized protein (TIGR02594 family)